MDDARSWLLGSVLGVILLGVFINHLSEAIPNPITWAVGLVLDRKVQPPVEKKIAVPGTEIGKGGSNPTGRWIVVGFRTTDGKRLTDQPTDPLSVGKRLVFDSSGALEGLSYDRHRHVRWEGDSKGSGLRVIELGKNGDLQDTLWSGTCKVSDDKESMTLSYNVAIPIYPKAEASNVREIIKISTLEPIGYRKEEVVAQLRRESLIRSWFPASREPL